LANEFAAFPGSTEGGSDYLSAEQAKFAEPFEE